MGITELAALLGTTPRALRYYEDADLIRSQRDRRGTRTYDPAVRSDLKMIVLLRRTGHSIVEIKKVLATQTSSGIPRSTVTDALLARGEELEKQLLQLRALISEIGDPGSPYYR